MVALSPVVPHGTNKRTPHLPINQRPHLVFIN
jgi:hypothetical protein